MVLKSNRCHVIFKHMSFKLLIHKKKLQKNLCPLSVGAFLAGHSSVLNSNFIGKSQTDLFDVSLLVLRIYIYESIP